MNTCSTCSSWCQINEGGARYLVMGECLAMPHLGVDCADVATEDVGSKELDKEIRALANIDAGVKDGSGYMAAFFTKPDFYCAKWSAHLQA